MKVQKNFCVRYELEWKRTCIALVSTMLAFLLELAALLCLMREQYVVPIVLLATLPFAILGTFCFFPKRLVEYWFTKRFFPWRDFQSKVLAEHVFGEDDVERKLVRWVAKKPLGRLKKQRYATWVALAFVSLVFVAISGSILASQSADSPRVGNITISQNGLLPSEVLVYPEEENDDNGTLPGSPGSVPSNPLPGTKTPGTPPTETNPVTPTHPTSPTIPPLTPTKPLQKPTVPPGIIPQTVENGKKLRDTIKDLGRIIEAINGGKIDDSTISATQNALDKLRANDLVSRYNADAIEGAIRDVERALERLSEALESGDAEQILKAAADLLAALANLLGELMKLWDEFSKLMDSLFGNSSGGGSSGQGGSSSGNGSGGSAGGASGGGAYSPGVQSGVYAFVNGTGTPKSDATFRERLDYEDGIITVNVDIPEQNPNGDFDPSSGQKSPTQSGGSNGGNGGGEPRKGETKAKSIKDVSQQTESPSLQGPA